MSIADFKPEIWSARLLRFLDPARVYSQSTCVNTDHQDEIAQMGDTVHIQKVGAVTIKTYAAGTPIDAPEHPSGSTVPLTIDTARYFNFAVRDVDAAQANVTLLDKFAKRAGVGMAKTIDSEVAASMVAGAGIDGGDLGTSAAPISVGNGAGDDFTVYELAVECRRLLDNNDAPADNRWMVIPPDLESTVLLDPQFVVAGANAQLTGQVGYIAGFNILKTTTVPTVTGTSGAHDSWAILFGAGNYATTHAAQIAETEAFRPESDFSDAIKGLNLWGTDVVEPETLGCALVDKG